MHRLGVGGHDLAEDALQGSVGWISRPMSIVQPPVLDARPVSPAMASRSSA